MRDGFGEEVDLLLKEIKLATEESPIDTLFFGGSFSSLDNIMLQKIFKALNDSFKLELKELAMECEVQDLTKKKIRNLEELGFTRLSLKTKTSCDFLLENLNEKYRQRDLTKVIENIKNSKIKTYSLDFYTGIIEQREKVVLKDLSFIKDHKIPQISLYEMGSCEVEYPEDSLRNWKLFAENLREMGYFQEEWLSFTKEEYSNIHHSKYWNGKQYIGLGLGAVSYTGNYTKNTENFEKYKELLSQEKKPIAERESDPLFLVFYHLNMGFRSLSGVNLKRIKEDYNIDIYEKNKDFIEDLISRNFIQLNDYYLSLTQEGFFIQDYILSKLSI